MMKLGLKSRSRRVVQDSSMAVEKSKIFTGKNKSDSDESCSYFCWASLPPELLREVLMKLEESESKWPARKHVVACAGVCKSWREMMKDVVKTPEASGKITFPISVKQVWFVKVLSAKKPKASHVPVSHIMKKSDRMHASMQDEGYCFNDF